MKFIQQLKYSLPIIYAALVSFGTTISIGGYGLLVLLFFLLLLNNINDLSNRKLQQLQVIDIRLYFIYVIIFFVCSFFNGDGDIGRNSLIINYLVCILIYEVISKDVRSKIDLDKITNILLILTVINCVITISQYNNNSLGWGVWYFFNDAQTVKQATMIENMKAGSQIIGKNYLFCPGIFPSVVYNGYVVGSLSPIALYVFYKARTSIQKIISGLSLLLIVYSLIVIQQRMAFFLFVLTFVAMLFSKNKLLTVLFAIGLLIAYLLYGFDIGEEQLGRLVDIEDKNRERLYANGYEYIFSHLWAGGRQEFMVLNRLSVHNIFFNAFMYGGVFGAAIIITIYMRMCVSSIKPILKSLKNGITESVAFAYALLIYNIISLTHNNSLLTGDPIIWVLYGLMLLSLKFEKNGQRA